MTRGFLLSLLAAHLLADFVCQSRRMVEAKSSRGWRRGGGFLLHGLIHLFWSIALLFGQWTSPVLFAAAGVVLFHVGLDWLKSGLQRGRSSLGNSLWIFCLDQIVHVAAILAASLVLGRYYGERVLDPACFRSFGALAVFLARLPERMKLLSALIVALCGTWGAGVAIRLYFQGRPKGNGGIIAAGPAGPCLPPEGTGASEGGFTIGLLERIIIILALLLRQEALIGFLLAVKSIARFKKFDNDCFIEYFIIGSSLSFLAAIVAGWLLRGLLMAQWM